MRCRALLPPASAAAAYGSAAAAAAHPALMKGGTQDVAVAAALAAAAVVPDVVAVGALPAALSAAVLDNKQYTEAYIEIERIYGKTRPMRRAAAAAAGGATIGAVARREAATVLRAHLCRGPCLSQLHVFRFVTALDLLKVVQLPLHGRHLLQQLLLSAAGLRLLVLR